MTAEIGQWRPAQDTHAIQVAAIGISFKEAVTGRVLNRCDSLISLNAAELGLAERNPINEVGIVFGSGAAQSRQEAAGVEFVRRERPEFVSDRLIISKDVIRFEEWSYTRWAVLASKLDKLIADAVDEYNRTTIVSEIYIEYTDVFAVPIESNESVFLILRQDSPFIANGASSHTGYWHTHSGFFDPTASDIRRLHRINVNVASAVGQDSEKRIVQIRTYVADQAYNPNDEFCGSLTEPWAGIAKRLECLHVAAKEDFRQLLTLEAANAISLG